MPELPEVETTRRGIEPHIVSQCIERVVVRDKRLRWPVPDDVAGFAGAKIVAAERRGKYIVVKTDKRQLLLHLGMSGSLRLCQASEPAMLHDHVDIVFTNGRALRLRDPRRFGAVLTCDDAYQHELLSKLGPEPLGADFTAEYMFAKSRGRTRNIKKFLMDGQVVVGVGNIYANEALFLAGIRPTVQAGKISLKRYALLVNAAVLVLKKAIEAGGTTLQDFVDSDGQPGYFANELAVYGREEQPCIKCQQTLKGIRIDNRATVYCRSCQR